MKARFSIPFFIFPGVFRSLPSCLVLGEATSDRICRRTPESKQDFKSPEPATVGSAHHELPFVFRFLNSTTALPRTLLKISTQNKKIKLQSSTRFTNKSYEQHLRHAWQITNKVYGIDIGWHNFIIEICLASTIPFITR